MTAARIRIEFAHWADISAQAERAYPRECCGLLVGTRDPGGDVTVTRVVPSPNVARHGGFDRFEVDPQVRFDLMRELRSGAEDIVGHYHSHPDHPAKPSQTDLDLAFEPDLAWLITAVMKSDKGGSAGKTRAWKLNRDTGAIQALDLIVVE
ncbi:MAG: M67 family metallopeptidase [Alphaproteobacteria bacterium]|nr:M67 family metallopeptidase [Alphaproteobacteria bacterium]MBF0250814.1 M67 family metallopeptidase [Alphaproteobacteria bacterium]